MLLFTFSHSEATILANLIAGVADVLNDKLEFTKNAVSSVYNFKKQLIGSAVNEENLNKLQDIWTYKKNKVVDAAQDVYNFKKKLIGAAVDLEEKKLNALEKLFTYKKNKIYEAGQHVYDFKKNLAKSLFDLKKKKNNYVKELLSTTATEPSETTEPTVTIEPGNSKDCKTVEEAIEICKLNEVCSPKSKLECSGHNQCQVVTKDICEQKPLCQLKTIRRPVCEK